MKKISFVNMYHNIQMWSKSAFSTSKKRVITTAIMSIAVVIFLVAVMIFSISLSIKASTKEKVITIEDAKALEDVDYIIVLGAGLKADGSPSDMLTDRLLTGIELTEHFASSKILLTGDDSGEKYNEVNSMCEFAVENGVSIENIELDGRGFSTYESIFRACNEFGAKKVVIVTQEYHLYRALYIAEELGLDAYGVSADIRTYRGQLYRDMREHMARAKDFFQCLLATSKNKN